MNVDHIRDLSHKNKLLYLALYPAIITRRALIKRQQALKNQVLDTFRELLVESPVISVKEFGGIFEIDPRSDLFARIIINKYYEPKLVSLCMKYLDRNRDVIDVGANIGFFTVMFAKEITPMRVLSIEPTPNALRRLRRNVELNGVTDNVEIFDGVASNCEGIASINTIAGKEEYSSLGVMDHPGISGETWNTRDVACTTLDKLVEDHKLNPGFLKIDVEGAENLVFEGACNLLKTYRPIIISELSNFLLKKNGSCSQDIIDKIKSYDYDIFDPIYPSREIGNRDFGDILCFPKEMEVKLK